MFFFCYSHVLSLSLSDVYKKMYVYVCIYLSLSHSNIVVANFVSTSHTLLAFFFLTFICCPSLRQCKNHKKNTIFLSVISFRQKFKKRCSQSICIYPHFVIQFSPPPFVSPLTNICEISLATFAIISPIQLSPHFTLSLSLSLSLTLSL